MRRRSRGSLLAAGLVLLGACTLGGGPVQAEQRLYHLRVTTADGNRYETLSSEGPYTYASLVGGTVHASRAYRRLWSPQVKVMVIDSWIEHRVPLRAHWQAILRERGFAGVHNHRLLQRRPPLSPDAMRVPEDAGLGTPVPAAGP